MNSISNWLPGVLPLVFNDPDVQIELTARLEGIDPRIKWEAGPSGEQDAYLAFSPNFHNDLLPVTEGLANAMPKTAGWRFFGAKPRKLWTVRKILLNGVEYFFENWRYRLVMFRNGEFFDVELFTFNEEIDKGILDRLGLFLISSELGEKLFMRAVDRVNVSFRPQGDESTIGIENLYDQIVDRFTGELPSE